MQGDTLPQSLRLDADLGPKSVSELKANLIAHRGQPLHLDGSDVTQIGGGCLQLLLSAQATWAVDGQAFALSSPSATLTETLRFSGLGEPFGIDSGAIE